MCRFSNFCSDQWLTLINATAWIFWNIPLGKLRYWQYEKFIWIWPAWSIFENDFIIFHLTNGLVVITFFINIQQETPHLLVSNVMRFSIYCLDKFSKDSYCGALGKSLQLFIAQLRICKGLIQTDKSINTLIFIDPVQHENNSFVQLCRHDMGISY